MLWLLTSLLTPLAAAAPPGAPPSEASEGAPLELDQSGKPEGPLPRVTPAPVISCCMSNSIIKQPILQVQDQIKACWTDLPRRHRPDRLKRLIQFGIPKGGRRPDLVRIKGDSHPIDACLIAVYQTLEYEAAAPCRWLATYPYLFSDSPPDPSDVSGPPPR